jgi:hypothetical protein
MINVVEEIKSAAALLERGMATRAEVAQELRNTARIIEDREQPVQLPENVDIVWSQYEPA